MATSQYNSKAFKEASAPHTQAFIEVSAFSGERNCTGFIGKAANTSMETFSAFQKPLSHHTSMKTLQDFPHHRGFMQPSTAPRRLDMGDFSANSANPCTINMMIKEEKLSSCMKRYPNSQIEKSLTCRHVAFCKRRNGLFQKAHELSILCDAEIAVIVFSPSGMMSEFASSSMSKIMKRYQSFYPQMPSYNVVLQDVESWKHKAILLSSQIKHLQYFQRYLYDNNNISLSINEIQSVESILEKTLDIVHKRKMELLEVQTHNIIEKGNFLCKENKVPKEKEWVIDAWSGRKELCYDQDKVNTKLQLGWDILPRTED